MSPLYDFPQSFRAFQRLFSSEEACQGYLIRSWWPLGFFCARCSSTDYWRLQKCPTLRCDVCGYEDSLTTGTIMQDTRTPLKLWFWTAYLLTDNEPMISPRVLQARLNVPHHRVACHLLNKLCAVMERPQPEKIGGIVELGVTSTSNAHHANNWEDRPSRTLIAGAIKVNQEAQKKRRRTQASLRLAVIPNGSSESLAVFAKSNVKEGSLIIASEHLPTRAFESCGYVNYAVRPTALTHILAAFTSLMTWLERQKYRLFAENPDAVLNKFLFSRRNASSRRETFHELLGFPTEEESKDSIMAELPGHGLRAVNAAFSGSLA